MLYLGHQRAPFWTPGDGSKNNLHTHPSALSHHAGIKGQRDCLWELALTAVLGKEHHSLGAYKIPNSPPVQKELGSWNREGKRAYWNFLRQMKLVWRPTPSCGLFPECSPEVLATSPAYLPFAMYGPERARPCSPLFSCPYSPQFLVLFSPGLAVKWNMPNPLLPPLLATLGTLGTRNIELGKSGPSQVSNFSSV